MGKGKTADVASVDARLQVVKGFRHGLVGGLLLLSLTQPARAAAQALSPEATQWWADIAALADDRNEGRLTGSSGYMRGAVRYIALQG